MEKNKKFVVFARSVGAITILITSIFAVLSFLWAYNDPNPMKQYVIVNYITFGLIVAISCLLGVILVLQKVDVDGYDKLQITREHATYVVLVATFMNAGMVLALIDLYF